MERKGALGAASAPAPHFCRLPVDIPREEAYLPWHVQRKKHRSAEVGSPPGNARSLAGAAILTPGFERIAQRRRWRKRISRAGIAQRTDAERGRAGSYVVGQRGSAHPQLHQTDWCRSFIFLSHIFLSASSRRRNRRISNLDKVGYDSGRNTQHNSESILTVICPFG